MKTQIKPTLGPELAHADEPKAQPRPRRKLTARRVRELLDCNPETGELFWRERPDSPQSWNTRYAGKPAGTCIGKRGYAVIRIEGKLYYTHRIVFLHTKGYWPSTLDHHDGDRTNRAIDNLRPGTSAQNNSNRACTASKKGFPRGCRQVTSGRWQVQIGANGRQIYIGTFAERDAAVRAYRDAAEMLHGEFSVTERRLN